MEFSASTPIGAQGILAARIPNNADAQVTRVNPNESSGKTGTDPEHARRNAEDAALAKSKTKPLAEFFQKDPPAGPPPSFEVSFLEVEQDLKTEIARMEAARSQDQNSEAVKGLSENPEAVENQPAASPEKDGPPDTEQGGEGSFQTNMGVVFQTKSSLV